MGQVLGGGLNQATSMNRIEQDVEMLKSMACRVDQIHDRIMRNARALGYFEPTPPGSGQAGVPTSVVTSMSDALRALMHAIERVDGALNVFD